jgi:RNA 3'-terminal phosphate cyclase (ATP)
MSREPLVIDGSMGEGGGQILRSALALSAILQQPVKIVNIRAKRRNPGLRPQHLTAVKALAALSHARVEGAYVGSTSLYFEPRHIRGGRYEFNVGTAGSVSLVLQALLPVAAFATAPVYVRVTGGTDVPMAPTIDYMRFVLLNHLSRIGFEASIRLLRRGHYPRGGGIVEVEVLDPPGGFRGVDYINTGLLRGLHIISHAVKLPKHVAVRQARAAEETLRERLGRGVAISVDLEWYEPGRDPHLGPGSGILVYAKYENTVLGADSLGQRGKRAEKVGKEAAEKLIEDMATGAPLDRHMSDMILIYLALADKSSEVRGAKLTSHAQTMFELLKLMVPGFSYEIREGSIGSPFRATIMPGAIPPK